MAKIVRVVSSFAAALLNGLQALAEASALGGEEGQDRLEYAVLAGVVAIIVIWLAVRYGSFVDHWWHNLLNSMSVGL